MNSYLNAAIKLDLNAYKKVNNRKIDCDDKCRIKLMVSVLLVSNPSLKGYRKRMIWQECVSFPTISQSLADQVRVIIRKGWFSDLEMLEILQKTNSEQDINTISNKPSIEKQEQSNRNYLETSENRNIPLPNNTE